MLTDQKRQYADRMLSTEKGRLTLTWAAAAEYYASWLTGRVALTGARFRGLLRWMPRYFFKSPLMASLTALHKKVDALMSDQSHLDADVDAMSAQETANAGFLAAIEAELGDLKAQAAAANVPLDFTKADALVASRKVEADRIASDAPAPAAPVDPAPPVGI